MSHIGNFCHLIDETWLLTLKSISMKIKFFSGEIVDIFSSLSNTKGLKFLKLEFDICFDEDDLLGEEDMENYDHVGGNRLSKIFESNESLERISLDIESFSYFDFSRSFQMMKLKEVSISHIGNVLKFLDECCPVLENLQLSFCTRFDGVEEYITDASMDNDITHMRNILGKITYFHTECHCEKNVTHNMTDFLQRTFEKYIDIPKLKALTICSRFPITNNLIFVQNINKQSMPKLDVFILYPTLSKETNPIFLDSYTLTKNVRMLLTPLFYFDSRWIEKNNVIQMIKCSAIGPKQTIESMYMFCKKKTLKYVEINLNFSTWSEINILHKEFQNAVSELEEKNNVNVNFKISETMKQCSTLCCDELKEIFFSQVR
jgi:hypothetical protein